MVDLAVPSLILWRHAEAEESAPGRVTDQARALTVHGHKQAARMAAWLAQRIPADARILVSPAVRTIQTAMKLQRPYAQDDRVGLTASPQSILAAAHWPQAYATVIVGHQPTLGQLASLLLQQYRPMELQRGEIMWIEHAGRSPRIKARLVPNEGNNVD